MKYTETVQSDRAFFSSFLLNYFFIFPIFKHGSCAHIILSSENHITFLYMLITLSLEFTCEGILLHCPSFYGLHCLWLFVCILGFITWLLLHCRFIEYLSCFLTHVLFHYKCRSWQNFFCRIHTGPLILNPPVLFPRCIHHLLAAFLPDPRAEGPLQELLYFALTVQCRHLAGIPQQRCQPHHLHYLQHWVSKSLHQDLALLRGTEMQSVPCQGKIRWREWVKGEGKYDQVSIHRKRGVRKWKIKD